MPRVIPVSASCAHPSVIRGGLVALTTSELVTSELMTSGLTTSELTMSELMTSELMTSSGPHTKSPPWPWR